MHFHTCQAGHRHSILCIMPPHVLRRIAERGSPAQRNAALKALALDSTMRSQRMTFQLMAAAAPAPVMAATGATPKLNRAIHTADNTENLPGTLVRAEGQPPSADQSVNEAYDGLGQTFDFYLKAYQRNSIDGRGLHLIASVHYDELYNNAFWNGHQMVFGDGDGETFNRFTASIDVIGHELTHGVTQYTAKLEYHDQPGALNESFSDVFGSLVKQRLLGQTAVTADWLIGEGTLVPSLGAALRSLKAPGTAWRGDTQPATMAGYKHLPDDGNPANDNGGVHLNSGIPNHAFYLAATAIGGNAWEQAGLIWYRTLTERLQPASDFAAAAQATVAVAAEQFGAGPVQNAVAAAWRAVGVPV